MSEDINAENKARALALAKEEAKEPEKPRRARKEEE